MTRAQLTSLHLARLGQLYPRPLAELGPNITEIPDDVAGIITEQLVNAALIDTDGSMSVQARTLLDPLFAYDHAFAAVIMLHNQRQRVTFDLDDEWVEYMRESLPITPRVYVLVAATGATVTTAIRAGDHVDVAQATTSDDLARVAARELLRVGDPDAQWSPADITAVSFPANILDRAPVRAPLPSADRKAHADHKETVYRFVAALRTAGASSRTVMAVEKFFELDHIAATHVSYVNGPRRLLSEGSATIDYFHNAGIAVGGLQKAGDGRMWKTLAPATPTEVAKALTDLTRLPARPMLDALSGY
ncbi:MAG: ESX secretion-associated protein EspG [Rhodococcus sp. (in: high G+C Gram-positive bacteria)]|uniref:ESX secretion-associated protein EspG n=1 Tax=Rhodococcus sp. TaxID=1831 RepID=UPI003BAFC4C0